VADCSSILQHNAVPALLFQGGSMVYTTPCLFVLSPRNACLGIISRLKKQWTKVPCLERESVVIWFLLTHSGGASFPSSSHKPRLSHTITRNLVSQQHQPTNHHNLKNISLGANDEN